jgi:hypothetical protein
MVLGFLDGMSGIKKDVSYIFEPRPSFSLEAPSSLNDFFTVGGRTCQIESLDLSFLSARGYKSKTIFHQRNIEIRMSNI